MDIYLLLPFCRGESKDKTQVGAVALCNPKFLGGNTEFLVGFNVYGVQDTKFND